MISAPPPKPSLMAALVIGALLPAVAWAGFPGNFNNEYEAPIERDPTALLGFDRSKENGVRFVERFDVSNLHFSCGDGTTERVIVSFPDQILPIVGGRFEGKVKTSTMLPRVLKVEASFNQGAARRA